MPAKKKTCQLETLSCGHMDGQENSMLEDALGYQPSLDLTSPIIPAEGDWSESELYQSSLPALAEEKDAPHQLLPDREKPVLPALALENEVFCLPETCNPSALLLHASAVREGTRLGAHWW